MQRLKTRPQFQAALKGDTVARTAHFALHRVALAAQLRSPPAASGAAPLDVRAVAAPVQVAAPDAPGALEASGALAADKAPARPGSAGALPVRSAAAPLFSVADAWLGAMVPKRWARRAVTRNAIKRQIYAVAASLDAPLPQAAHVVRLRATFDRKQFVSASSCALQQAVRAELVQLFARAAAAPAPASVASAVPAAPVAAAAGRGAAA